MLDVTKCWPDEQCNIILVQNANWGSFLAHSVLKHIVIKITRYRYNVQLNVKLKNWKEHGSGSHQEHLSTILCDLHWQFHLNPVWNFLLSYLLYFSKFLESAEMTEMTELLFTLRFWASRLSMHKTDGFHTRGNFIEFHSISISDLFRKLFGCLFIMLAITIG